jgi:hypothetical protein
MYTREYFQGDCVDTNPSSGNQEFGKLNGNQCMFNPTPSQININSSGNFCDMQQESCTTTTDYTSNNNRTEDRFTPDNNNCYPPDTPSSILETVCNDTEQVLQKLTKCNTGVKPICVNRNGTDCYNKNKPLDFFKHKCAEQNKELKTVIKCDEYTFRPACYTPTYTSELITECHPYSDNNKEIFNRWCIIEFPDKLHGKITSNTFPNNTPYTLSNGGYKKILIHPKYTECPSNYTEGSCASNKNSIRQYQSQCPRGYARAVCSPEYYNGILIDK